MRLDRPRSCLKLVVYMRNYSISSAQLVSRRRPPRSAYKLLNWWQNKHFLFIAEAIPQTYATSHDNSYYLLAGYLFRLGFRYRIDIDMIVRLRVAGMTFTQEADIHMVIFDSPHC